MAVICLVDGGSTEVARFAARQLWQSAGWTDLKIGHLTCSQDADKLATESQVSLGASSLPGRELIASVRRLQRSHDHVVLDASGTSDQTIALAVALSDLAITPLCLDEPDYGAFAHAVDLVRVVAENLRRPEKHCIFLASRHQAPLAGTLVQVSGLLAMKGLLTLPVPLCRWDQGAGDESEGIGNRVEPHHSTFLYSVFDLIERQFTPVVRQRHFG